MRLIQCKFQKKKDADLLLEAITSLGSTVSPLYSSVAGTFLARILTKAFQLKNQGPKKLSEFYSSLLKIPEDSVPEIADVLHDLVSKNLNPREHDIVQGAITYLGEGLVLCGADDLLKELNANSELIQSRFSRLNIQNYTPPRYSNPPPVAWSSTPPEINQVWPLLRKDTVLQELEVTLNIHVPIVEQFFKNLMRCMSQIGACRCYWPGKGVLQRLGPIEILFMRNYSRKEAVSISSKCHANVTSDKHRKQQLAIILKNSKRTLHGVPMNWMLMLCVENFQPQMHQPNRRKVKPRY